MRIINTTKDTLISEDAQIACSFSDRVLGLLKNSSKRSLIFRTRFGIHTIFMSKPIDVIVLSRDNEVVKIKSSLKPYKFFFYSPLFSDIIELPEGTIVNSDTYLGDKISIG